MQARFVRHAFGRHSHPTYAIGVIERGVEELRVGGTVERIVPGGLALLNPGVVHTGTPAIPAGWSYRVLYPTVELVAEVTGVASPRFGRHLVYDAAAATRVLAAHRASESGDRLYASTVLRETIARLWEAYGGGTLREEPRAGSAALSRARDVLHECIAAPPSLDELADEVGTGRFALVRAFRDRFGLPPHAYLNEQRVRRACELLDRGVPPGEVAAAVGFADQSHLTRHFRRIVGVPPGRYQRKNVQDPC